MDGSGGKGRAARGSSSSNLVSLATTAANRYPTSMNSSRGEYSTRRTAAATTVTAGSARPPVDSQSARLRTGVAVQHRRPGRHARIHVVGQPQQSLLKVVGQRLPPAVGRGREPTQQHDRVQRPGVRRRRRHQRRHRPVGQRGRDLVQPVQHDLGRPRLGRHRGAPAAFALDRADPERWRVPGANGSGRRAEHSRQPVARGRRAPGGQPRRDAQPGQDRRQRVSQSGPVGVGQHHHRGENPFQRNGIHVVIRRHEVGPGQQSGHLLGQFGRRPDRSPA